MTTDKWAELRKPFAPAQIGKLPKPYKADSPKGNCKECGKYHGLPAVHLDYVGHAVLTARLLAVDPEWFWEPLGHDEHGLPALDRAGNLWIRLHILGMNRIGVGDGKNMKEAVGDSLRNAAMRFGVALDLWAKEELEVPPGDAEPNPKPQPKPEQRPDPPLGPAVFNAEAASRGESAWSNRPANPPVDLKAVIWAESKKRDPELDDEQRKAWIRGELAALGGDSDDHMRDLLRAWAK